MSISSAILLISLLSLHGVSSETECVDTKIIVSKCYNHGEYQWLIEVPRSKDSCKEQTTAQPTRVSCDFTCPKGQTFNKANLDCKSCSKGTFSLGGGNQYTFNELDDLKVTMPELTLKTTSLVESYDGDCKKKSNWRIKGNLLQGEVQHNCVLILSLQFKLQRSGSISVTYNLPTSFVFGSISSRCDFSIDDKDKTDDADNNDDDDYNGNPKKKAEVTFNPTGYGIWKEKRIVINEPGEYVLSLLSFGANALHFPFYIRSIVVEGNAFLQDCIECPPGTFADTKGASNCAPCPKNTYAANSRSTECIPCGETQYSDEGSSKCIERPKCEEKHYQKVFTGCVTSKMATITYRPIEPKICIGDVTLPADKQLPCGTCNPGMFKNISSGKCEFCPPKTYSNGTLSACLPCANDLSLVPGLYYKIWNDLPDYLNRSYLSFDDMDSVSKLRPNQSWIPSIEYISSQSIPDTLSVLTLSITKGFRATDIARATKEFGTLYFKFSTRCNSSCTLFLVAEDMYDDDDSNWQVIHKWHITKNSEHKDIEDFRYTILNRNEVVFNWMFTSDSEDQGGDEVRIYEILVTNTNFGGSDRCVACLTTNDEETECKQCTSGYILTSNNTCTACPNSTIASRKRSRDPVPTICTPCPTNTISDDGISCYVPCKQMFSGDIPYDLNAISTIQFHGSKLFTQKGSGYFHVFNASICGKASVTCVTSLASADIKNRKSQKIIDSKLCRLGSVPDQNDNITSVAYIDEFGEELVSVSLSVSKYFPPLRSDYNLTDITLVYRANASYTESTCLQRTTFLSLRCDHILNDEQQKSNATYQLQTPSNCAAGTCDGCTFHFLLRTPLACPICDSNSNGYRTFIGPCRFGRQEVRKIPYPYCANSLAEKVDTRRCSVLSTEVQIVFAVFLLVAAILILVLIKFWRKNRKLEYRYMQLVENTNPDDDTPVDNVCAQISDEEDSGTEVHFTKPSKAKKLMNVVRNAIRKNPNDNQSDFFNGDSFLLTSQTKDDA
ncbi:unnamed protein product [Adineta ricciae]|uniref:MRH domain-containing protein n=1 Tax=Adineta ricciae TaxID=249248 RepID=A0A815MP98_ADIRI|nr:unnamed protein product [Adineta ricciae]CAF1424207.1 unnamed protein product [Adineta ricciae]